MLISTPAGQFLSVIKTDRLQTIQFIKTTIFHACMRKSNLRLVHNQKTCTVIVYSFSTSLDLKRLYTETSKHAWNWPRQRDPLTDQMVSYTCMYNVFNTCSFRLLEYRPHTELFSCAILSSCSQPSLDYRFWSCLVIMLKLGFLKPFSFSLHNAYRYLFGLGVLLTTHQLPS